MSIKVNAATINGFITYAEKNAKDAVVNRNIDTADEKAIFVKKCKTAGIENVDDILNNYSENKVQMEAEYQANKTLASKNYETAIISAFNSDSALRVNEKAIKTANTIKAGIKNADGNTKWWSPKTWFNNEEEVLDSVNLIDENNVVEVLSDNEVVKKIAEADPEVRETAANHIVEQLVKHAADKQLDVSNIVIEKNGEYVVGSDVKGVRYGKPVSENLTAVVNALLTQINNDKNTVAGKDAKKEEMLTIAAKRIDADGNGNGYIDTDEETEAFKQFAAKHGYDVDTILEEIRDNETNGVENTTAAQKLIFNIFDPEQKAAYEKLMAQETKNITKELEIGVEDDNKEALDSAISKVNSDNVMDILNNSPKLIDNIMDKYSHNWFVNIFCDDKYADYTTPILKALVEKAENEGIDIEDIIYKGIVGPASGCRAGSKADSEENIAKVIKALQARINKA